METYIVGLALLIFLALVYWKGKAAIAAGLDKKIESIRSEIAQAAQLREEAESLFAEKSKLAESAADEAAAIVAQAGEEAERHRRNAVETFEAVAERRRAQAETKIAQAEAEAVRTVRAEATNIALTAARQVIRAEMTGARAEALLDSAIDDLPGRLG